MNNNLKAIAVALVSCGLGFAVPSFAGQQLDAINAEVEQHSAYIDQKYGVLLDFQERTDLKLDLIAKKALADAAGSGKSIQEVTEEAISTFEITDLYEQRKLLVKIEYQITIQESTGTSGKLPDYP